MRVSKTISKTKLSRRTPRYLKSSLTQRQIDKINREFLEDPAVFSVIHREFSKDALLSAMGGCSLFLMCMAHAPDELMDQIMVLVEQGASYSH